MTPLQSNWVELLDRIPWTYFVTLTFDRQRYVHPEAIGKKVTLWGRRCAEDIFGRKRAREVPPFALMYGLEKHKDGRPHLHPLVYHPYLSSEDKDTRLRLMSLWDNGSFAHPKSLREGFARVLPCKIGAKEYVSKSYVSKDCERGEIYLTDSVMPYLLPRKIV